MLADEESFDGHPTWEWAFKQCRHIDLNTKTNMVEKELCLNLTKFNHECNQHRHVQKKLSNNKLWQVLLDRQSTCNVIVNLALVTNIRKCKWTL